MLNEREGDQVAESTVAEAKKILVKHHRRPSPELSTRTVKQVFCSERDCECEGTCECEGECEC